MATIGTERNGHRRVLFVAADGSRKTVRLGKCSRRDAEGIRLHIEALAAASIHRQALSRETSVWLAAIGGKLHDRLARAGLAEPRKPPEAVTLGPFIDGYLAQRGDVKPGTLIVFRQARRWLVRFLGENKPVVDVTPGDADAYRAHLLTEGRARATVAKWCQYARHFFEVAKRRRLMAENPFAHIKDTVRGNVARRVFVSAADVQKVIEAASDPQWKLLIALGRWGGLRIPSEALALTWADVDLERGRFIVRASKTAHHEGGGVRVVPIFRELRSHFEAVFASDAAEGAVHVITRYRDPAANLRTQFCRYIAAAGLKPWQNLRSSRATELADEFPSHVCAAWLGHTEAVADEFYRQVTDDHFARAIGAAQNPAQQPLATARDEQKVQSHDERGTHDLQGVAGGHGSLRNGGLGALGIEQPHDSTGTTQATSESGAHGRRASCTEPAQGGTVPTGHDDPDLSAILTQWPRLPATARAAVRRLAERLGAAQDMPDDAKATGDAEETQGGR